MLFDPLFERFAAGTPLSVMTRALLENTLQPKALDDLFERLAIKQYTRELLFSTVVATMTLVACRFYKSPRSVYTEHEHLFGVTLSGREGHAQLGGKRVGCLGVVAAKCLGIQTCCSTPSSSVSPPAHL